MPTVVVEPVESIRSPWENVHAYLCSIHCVDPLHPCSCVVVNAVIKHQYPLQNTRVLLEGSESFSYT